MTNTINIGSFFSAVFIICAVVIIASCSSSSPALSKEKFSGVNGAALEVGKTLSSGGDYKAFSAALQKLSLEIAALKNNVRTDQEKDLLKDYSDLYAIYHDGYVLWKYKIEFTRYGFVPENLIYVGQDIEPIVIKYRIPVEFHVYAPTQQSWKSIPAESLQMIWTNADSEMQIINSILSYR
ncbi:MAG: hypothetical protein HQL09_08080 [Nitrospirae bacterium]|nr:hypothetical protein [Nitrospirota bacterium]